jgi:hypothetical protein
MIDVGIPEVFNLLPLSIGRIMARPVKPMPLHRLREISNRVRAFIESVHAFFWAEYHDVGQLQQLIEVEARIVARDTVKPDTITDDFGSTWSVFCDKCGRRSMEVVRIGKAQCPFCD